MPNPREMEAIVRRLLGDLPPEAPAPERPVLPVVPVHYGQAEAYVRAVAPDPQKAAVTFNRLAAVLGREVDRNEIIAVAVLLCTLCNSSQRNIWQQRGVSAVEWPRLRGRRAARSRELYDLLFGGQRGRERSAEEAAAAAEALLKYLAIDTLAELDGEPEREGQDGSQ